MIVGNTVSTQGEIIHRVPVSVKLAIGLGPGGDRKAPERLFHFLVLKRGTQKGEWVVDPELMKKIAPRCEHKDWSDECPYCCREIKVVLLADDPEEVFPNELAYWRQSKGRFCHGDGVKAERKADNGVWIDWTKDHPCRNGGCPDWQAQDCKPSADLRVMIPLLDWRIARIHTSSMRSIEQVWGGLLLARSWAGRLAGATVPLRVTREQSYYLDKGGERRSTTVPILSIAVNPRELAQDVKETGVLIREARAAFNFEDEDEEDRDREIPPEFPPASEQPQPKLPAPEPAKIDTSLPPTAAKAEPERAAQVGTASGGAPERTPSPAVPTKATGEAAATASSTSQETPKTKSKVSPAVTGEAAEPEKPKPEPIGKETIDGYVVDITKRKARGKDFWVAEIKVQGGEQRYSIIVRDQPVKVALDEFKQSGRLARFMCELYEPVSQPREGKTRLCIEAALKSKPEATPEDPEESGGDFSWML